MVADGQRRRQRGAPDPRGARRPGLEGRHAAHGRRHPRPPARGAWLTTTANLWGSLALDKFSAKFESTPVAGQTRVALDRDAATGVGRGVAASARRRLGAQAERRRARARRGRRRGARSTSSQEGSGKPWLTVQSLAAVPLKAPLRAGYAITRTVTRGRAEGQGAAGRAATSLRVRLEIDAQSDMTWVVVSDPVPGGATILGRGLGRDSQIATRGEKRERHAPGRRSRSAASRPSAATTSTCRSGKHVDRVHRAPEQPGPLRAAADARRGDVRARELRRDAERGDRGRAVTRVPRAIARAAACVASALALCGARVAGARTRCRRFAEVQGRAPAVRRHPRSIATARRSRPCASTSTVRRLAWVPLAEMSPALLHGDRAERGPALLRARRRRLAARRRTSAWGNLWNTRTRGASTLTMQLAGLLDDGLARPRRRPQRRRRSSARR